MNVYALVLFFCIIITPEAGSMTQDGRISNKEILQSFKDVKNAVEKQGSDENRKLAADKCIYFDLTKYTLNLAIDHLNLVINLTRQTDQLIAMFNKIIASIEKNTAFKNTQLAHHSELIAFYTKIFELLKNNRTILTHRDVVLLFFDLHKHIIVTYARKWDFDFKTVSFSV